MIGQFTFLSGSDYAAAVIEFEFPTLCPDDTSMRVLRLVREPSDDRTGVFTSGIVSTQQGRRIALYFTGTPATPA